MQRPTRADQGQPDHGQITARTARLEEAAFTLLALQAPVAGDLRAVVAAIKNVADVERMGALALHVAKVVRRRHPAHTLPEDVKGYFAEMGRIAVENAVHAIKGEPVEPEAKVRIELITKENMK